MVAGFDRSQGRGCRFMIVNFNFDAIFYDPEDFKKHVILIFRWFWIRVSSKEIANKNQKRTTLIRSN